MKQAGVTIATIQQGQKVWLLHKATFIQTHSFNAATRVQNKGIQVKI